MKAWMRAEARLDSSPTKMFRRRPPISMHLSQEQAADTGDWEREAFKEPVGDEEA